MTDKIKALFYKIIPPKYREVVLYLIFGVLTTLVSLGVYYALLWCGIHYITAQIVSWAAAVAFAFVTNKLFVFNDKDTRGDTLFRQIWQFVSVRILSGVLETALLWLMVDILLIGEEIAKIPVAVITVVVNYVASKLFVFKKR